MSKVHDGCLTGSNDHNIKFTNKSNYNIEVRTTYDDVINTDDVTTSIIYRSQNDVRTPEKKHTLL